MTQIQAAGAAAGEGTARTILIGDVHGCAAALSALLELAAPAEGDTLVMLGDLFDRGPDSFEVYQKVQALSEAFGSRFVLLRGNHEDYLLAQRLTLGQRIVWERVGRRATVNSFREHGARMEDAIPFLQSRCVPWWKGGRLQAVHAGLRKDPPEANDLFTLIHDHGVGPSNRYAGPLTVFGHIALDCAMHFAGDGKTRNLLPWGEWLPLPRYGALCIDTGCGKGGRLTAMIVSGGQYRLECVPERGA